MNILVTGASKGIGYAIARELCSLGDVFVTGRDEKALREFKSYCLCDLNRRCTGYCKNNNLPLNIIEIGIGKYYDISDYLSNKNEINIIDQKISRAKANKQDDKVHELMRIRSKMIEKAVQSTKVPVEKIEPIKIRNSYFDD